jgi:BMFP domain-containing protein YqiC
MALTKDDLQQIENVVKNIVSESEKNLREDLQKEIHSTEVSLREEIQYNRAEIKSIKAELTEIREKLEEFNASRTDDGDLAFDMITKLREKVDRLEQKVKKMEEARA